MNIKQLIKAELDHLSTQELQEFYELLKSRSQDKKRLIMILIGINFPKY